jgi:hypothetical protein
MKMLKIKNWLVIIILLSVIYSCSSSKQTLTTPSAEVNFLSSIDGTITMRANGIGKSEGEAIGDAMFNAFDVLFFRGLPESEQKNALIGTNENEAREQYKEYFNAFYKGRYKTFVMSSVPTSDLIKYTGGEKGIAIDVKINVVSLRKDLEQNNIIRKFGF